MAARSLIVLVLGVLATQVRCECPEGWITGDGMGCYQLLNDGMYSWDESSVKCQSLGSYLAEIPTREIMNFLLKAFEEVDTDGHPIWFVGLSDRFHEGEWKWIRSGIDLDPSLWTPGSPRPEYADVCNCAQLVIVPGEEGFFDSRCDSMDYVAGYICETDHV